MEYVIEKWGGRPHYAGAVRYLGDDEFGSWLWGPAGRCIYRSGAPLFLTSQDMVSVVRPGAWWTPAWWWGHPQVEVYVNINTPVARQVDRMVTVDLDLDVIKFTHGGVEVVDRDEFEVHQRLYDYPADVIEATEAATTDVARRVIRNEPPFDGVRARAWADYARRTA